MRDIKNKRLYNVGNIFEILKERGLETSKPTIREYLRILEPLLRTMKAVTRANRSPSGSWLLDGRGVIALIKFVELQGRPYKHGKKGNIEKKLEKLARQLRKERIFSPEDQAIETEENLTSLAIIPYLRKEINRLQRRVDENRLEIKRLRREIEALKGNAGQ